MNRIVPLAFLVFAAVLVLPSLSASTPNPLQQFFNCDSLFQTGYTSVGTGTPFPLVSPSLLTLDGINPNGGPGNNGASFTGMLTIAFLLVLLMLSVLGIVYGIGLAFGINKLVVFVKTEYAETLANVVIIAVVFAGGFALFNNGTIFLSNIAAGAVSTGGNLNNLATATGLGTGQMFTNLCSNYNTGIIATNLENYVGVIIQLIFYNVLIMTNVKLMPNGFGFTMAPLYGVQTLRTSIWSEEGISFAIIMMGAMLILLLFVIYFLFPIFFYVGLVLRCFPWTRAAGGSMLAMFIAFYIVFPAILYPFSLVGPANPQLCSSTGTTSIDVINICNVQNFANKVGSETGGSASQVVDTIFSLLNGGAGFGNAMFENANDFSIEVAYSMLQIVGVIIAFIISYDLLEFLGDFLGAPSLQSNKILSKVL